MFCVSKSAECSIRVLADTIMYTNRAKLNRGDREGKYMVH